jgi:hypothetical protein
MLPEDPCRHEPLSTRPECSINLSDGPSERVTVLTLCDWAGRDAPVAAS